MPAPSYSAADYQAALQALLPRGRIWPRDADATQNQVVAGLTAIYERHNARANQLLVDAFPATTYELLPEWEETLGLPDACAGALPTVAQRRNAVLSKFTGTGGQSAAYFITHAAALGFTITITNFTPFRLGQQRMGDSLGSPDWAHTWAVNSALNTLIPFRMSVSVMGDPLEIWGNTVLECALKAIAPAHTVLQFRYQ